MLMHNFENVSAGVSGPSAYGYSADGHNWTLSREIPYDCTLMFTDGSNLSVGGCGNRPKLAFQPGSDAVPIGLFSGAGRHPPTKPGGAAGEYTLFRPVMSAPTDDADKAAVATASDTGLQLKTDDTANSMPAVQPHIFFALADDTGWNSVGWHARSNSAKLEVSTPNLDALARNGIELSRSYAFKYCSPSRCSIQSGRNPIHVQTGNAVFGTGGGIPSNMTCLATKLKQRGYRTVMAGKVCWHIPQSVRSVFMCLPNRRALTASSLS